MMTLMAKIYLLLHFYIKKKKAYLFKLIIINQAKKVGDSLKVNGYSIINKNTSLGNNVNFNGMMIQGKGEVFIGDNFHSGTSCQMLTEIHNYDNGEKIPYDHTYITKNIVIEDNVWLGNNVILLGDIRIGEGAIVQAGSVVVGDIPKYAIAGGHPAKVFSYRSIEHYNRLKSKKAFH